MSAIAFWLRWVWRVGVIALLLKDRSVDAEEDSREKNRGNRQGEHCHGKVGSKFG